MSASTRLRRVVGYRQVLAAALLFGPLWSGSVHAADRFLPADEAFRLEARRLSPDQAELRFTIAPGYYLYRAPLAVQADGAQVGPLTLPAGVVKFDENFQKQVETYQGTLHVGVPLQAASGPVTLVVQSQGCAEAGLCYPLSTTKVRLADSSGSGASSWLMARPDAQPRPGLAVTPGTGAMGTPSTLPPGAPATPGQDQASGRNTVWLWGLGAVTLAAGVIWRIRRGRGKLGSR